MKHLISLSLKYIRRQKLRSMLTFLCIMLAVFILNSASAYCGSIYKTILHSVMDQSGSWEVDLSKVLHDAPKENAYDIIRHHAAVEDSYIMQSSTARGSRYRFHEDDAYSGIRYYQIDLDGQSAIRTFELYHYAQEGNSYLYYGAGKNTHPMMDVPETAGCAYVPDWFREYGYEVGDTVKITVTPVRAELSEDSEQVIAARQLFDELNAESEEQYYIADEPDTDISYSQSDIRYPLLSYMAELYTLEDIEFSSEQPEEPYVIKLTISGFRNAVHSYINPKSGAVSDRVLDLYTSAATDIDFSGLASNEEQKKDAFLCVRMNQRMDMDDALMALFKDLGYDENAYVDYLNPYARSVYNTKVYHSDLLKWELRGADVITEMIPQIVIVLVLIVVLWFVARFVIDNAFEISVQERSSQFAVLRIMGASQRQLMALVFTEAVAYCLTAIPVGALTAFLSCRYVMERFHALGFDAFTFYVNPYITIIGVCLSILAIFISAYTSAMWAARKLSPLEALQYGKPRKKKEKLRHKARKLTRKSKSFILRYTLKNILRTRQRFLVASIAMGLGVMLFTFCALAGITVTDMTRHLMELEINSDYTIYIHDLHPDAAQEAEKVFGESESIARYYSNMPFTMYSTSESSYLLHAIQPEPAHDPSIDALSPDSLGDKVDGVLVTEQFYTQHIEPVTGISYDAFLDSGAAMVYCSPYIKDGEYIFENYTYTRQSEDGWYPLTEAKSVSIGQDAVIPLLGVVCFDAVTHMQMMGRLILPADTEMIPENAIYHGSTYLKITVNGTKHLSDARALTTDFTDRLEYSYTFMDSYIENTGLMEFVRTIITAAAILLLCIWLTGVLSMVNSINTSVLNRQNELIMMRAVGMTKRQLMGTVVLESVLFSGISTIAGLVPGVIGFVVVLGVVELETALITIPPAILIPAVMLLTLVLNLMIALLAALPGLQSLGRRLKNV